MSLADKALDSFVDFVLSQPKLEQIAAFNFPDELDAELHDYLDKNSQGMLSQEEKPELEAVLQLGHLVTLLKVKAFDILDTEGK
jgi:hypothetical protein